MSLYRLLRKAVRIESYLITLIFIGENIMSVISDFAAKQSAFNDRMDVAIGDLKDDVKTLNDQIVKLQNTPGAITSEDQALLDGLQTRTEGIATKLEALDALTPPAVPVVPPAA